MDSKPKHQRTTDVAKLRMKARQNLADDQLIAALKAFDRIIELEQANVDDWRETGKALSRLGEFAQAIGAFERGLEIDSDDLETRHDLGRAFYKLGQVDQAVRLLASVASETDSTACHMGLATIAPGAPSLDHADVLRVRKKYAAAVRRIELLGQATIRPSFPSRQDRPLKIGYVSAHFHQPNYMMPVWPLINAHRADLEIVLLDDATEKPQTMDWLTRKATIVDIASLSNIETAEKIRALNIDVLVDLNAYSNPHRLGIFVHRPAGCQIAWFNMYATSGFDEIDFIVGDDHAVFESEDEHYVETVHRLPLSYLTYRPKAGTPKLKMRDASPFTYGCLGTQYKITPIVIEAWCKILRAAQGTRLILANRELASPQNQGFVIDQMDRHGVDAKRLKFLPPAESHQFLEYYDQIDLALDTFPYSGGTTTMEALWQGVPVVTCNGDRWASRTSASIIARTHIPQFAVDSIDDYVELAIHYGCSLVAQEELKDIRREMRARLLSSSACDSQQLAKQMEAFYLDAFERTRAR